MELLNEDFTEEFSLLAEEEIRDGKKSICFRGIFSEADKMNRNHRIYPRKVLKEAYEQAWDAAKKSGNPIIGECEHPADNKIHLERIAVTFPELVWNEEKGTIEGKAIPTETEKGKLIEGLAKSGIKICFSTRCAGKVKPYKGPLAEGAMDAVEVQPGLRIISIDCVGQPSCQKAVSSTVYEEASLTEENIETKTNLQKIFEQAF